MRLLYGAPLGFGQTSEHRLRALRRLVGDEVVEFRYDDFFDGRWPRLRALGERSGLTPAIWAMNRALLERVERLAPDVVWLDKPLHFTGATIRHLMRNGVRVVSYLLDDPYGPRNDAGWRLFKQALPCYWAHVVPRQVSVPEFQQRGAERVVCAPLAFEPSVHFPPAALGLSVPKSIDISYVGSPLEERPAWIVRLAHALPEVKIAVYGPGWRRHRTLLQAAGIGCQDAVWNDQYREVIWRSRLSLSFITRLNREEASHKAIEIAACGTPVFLQSSPVHDQVFRHRESAYFFADPETLAPVVREALAQREEHGRIGQAAARAVRAAQLSNDAVLARALTALGLIKPPARAMPAFPSALA